MDKSNYRIKITKVGKIQETHSLIKDLIKVGSGREISFLLKSIPCELNKTFNHDEMRYVLSKLEFLENNIEITETILKPLRDRNEKRVFYTTEGGLLRSFEDRPYSV